MGPANTKQVIASVLGKVPYWSRSYARQYPGHLGLNFVNLKDFLEDRTAITTDPLLQATFERAKALGYKRSPDSRSKASMSRAFNVVGDDEGDEEERCFLCDGPLHSVFECRVFLNYDEKTRFKKLYKARCLNCGEKHASWDCGDERRCKDKSCPILTKHSPKLHGGFRKWNEAKQKNDNNHRANDERNHNNHRANDERNYNDHRANDERNHNDHRANDERNYDDGHSDRGAHDTSNNRSHATSGRGVGRGRGGYSRDQPVFTRSVGRGGIGGYNTFGGNRAHLAQADQTTSADQMASADQITTEAQVHKASSVNSGTLLNVVPIIIRGAHGKRVSTFCHLDPCADTNFITEPLKKMLSLHGRKVQQPLTTALGRGRIDTELVDADILDFPRGTRMLATTQFHVVPPDHLNFARIPSITGDLKRTFPRLGFDVEIKAVSVLIGVQADTLHLHRVTESNVSSDGRFILQQTPLGCTIIGVSGDLSTQARSVNLVRTLRDDEPPYNQTNLFRQPENFSSSCHNNNNVPDTGQPLQPSPAIAGSSLTTRRRSLRDAQQLYPRPREQTQRAPCLAHWRPSVLAHFGSNRQHARLLFSNSENSFSRNKMAERDHIEEEMRRQRLMPQPYRTVPATDGESEARLRRLREEKARKTAEIERLRAENERMAQVTKRYNDECDRLEKEIEEFTRRHHLPPPDGKKE